MAENKIADIYSEFMKHDNWRWTPENGYACVCSDHQYGFQRPTEPMLLAHRDAMVAKLLMVTLSDVLPEEAFLRCMGLPVEDAERN